ncbi:DMT family transporter [Shimia sp.]|uniref:DMT family transporter n=1 Tax=Shimia sp. TaxID=1954381 RepID=UPI003B8BE577
MGDPKQRAGDLSTITVAVVMMLAANALFSMTDTSTKWLLAGGYAALQLAFLRYAVQFAITSVDVARRGPQRLRLPVKVWAVLFVRASLLVGSTIVNFVALKFLSLTMTSAIMFSSPIFVCLLSGPLLGEQVGAKRWAFVGLGFVGVLVVIRPFGQDIEWAAVMMLLPAIGLALYSILTRKLAKDVDAATMQFALGLLGTLVLAPLAMSVWTAPSRPLDWVFMGAIGVCAWAGHELLIRAHKRAEASFLMPFSYSYLVFMALASVLVFHDVPDFATLLGAVLITASGILIWHHSRSAKA